MTRRDAVVIAVIVVVALCGVLLLRDVFSMRKVTPPERGALYSGREVDLHVPVADPAPEAQRGPSHNFTFELRNARSGPRMESGSVVEIADLAGNRLVLLDGVRDGAAIGYSAIPGLPFRARVSRPGLTSRVVGPFAALPGVQRTITVEFERARRLEVRVSRADVNKEVTVFSAVPPRWPARPLVRRLKAVSGACVFQVPAGDYWVVVGGEFGAGNDLPIRGEVWTRQVSVGADDVVVEADAAQRGTSAIEVRLGGAAACAGVVMEVIACGPGPMRRTMWTAIPDADGVLRAPDLPAGLTHIVVWGENSGAELWATLAAGETSRLEAVMIPRRHGANGLFRGPRVGSARVLRRGVPVPGAVLWREGWGKLLGYSTDGRSDRIGVANAEGVVEPDSAWADDYVVKTFPSCGTLFDFAYEPGAAGVATFEIWPQGTGGLRADLRAHRLHFGMVRLTRPADPDYRAFIAENDGILEITGVPSGDYVLYGNDDNWFDHEMAVRVEADRITEIANPFPTRKISAAWPSDGFWLGGAQLTSGDPGSAAGGPLNFDSGWPDPKRRVPVKADKTGFSIECAPARALRLFAMTDWQIVAMADIPAGLEDIKVEWKPAPPVAEARPLLRRTPPAAKKETWRPRWWTVPAPRPLQPAPEIALALPPDDELANEDYEYAAGCVELHVQGATPEQLWQAEVRFHNDRIRPAEIHAARVVATRLGRPQASLAQVEGRPVLMWPRQKEGDVRLLLLVPGCKPAGFDVRANERAVAVTLERE